MRFRSHQQYLQQLVPETNAKTYSRPNRARTVIIFTPRSGSSWLADMLIATGQIGYPNEYCNQALMHEVKVNARTELDFLHAIEQNCSGPNEHFSIEITYGDIERFETIDFFDHFRGAFFVNLRRADIVDQAISCHLATRTGVYHKDGESILGMPDPDIERSQILTNPRLMAEIRHWCTHLLQYECLTEIQFSKAGITPFRITYEEVCRTPQEAINTLICNSGRQPPKHRAESSYVRLADELNEEIKNRFLFEERTFLDRALNLRPPLTVQE